MLKKVTNRPDRHNINLKDTNKLQYEIMIFVDIWVHEFKTPVPHRQIIVKMKDQGHKDFTTVNAIASLLRKSYLRKAVTMSNKNRSYVQLRRV